MDGRLGRRRHRSSNLVTPSGRASPAHHPRIISLDASDWSVGTDLYKAVLPLLGALRWHSYSQDAIVESMVWGEINAIEPSYLLRIHGTASLPPGVAEELGWLEEGVTDGRAEFNVRRGLDVDIDVELLP